MPGLDGATIVKTVNVTVLKCRSETFDSSHGLLVWRR